MVLTKNFIVSNKMGNLCFLNSSSRNSAMTAPQNIEELLKSLKGDIDVENVDKTIDESRWAKKFQDYLNSKNPDDINTFKFLVKMEALKRLSTSPREKKQSMFRKIVRGHFHEDCDILPLSNGQLSDFLIDWANSGDNHTAVTDGDIEKLFLARNDPKVLSENLETSFQAFVACHPALSIKACLLSIM